MLVWAPPSFVSNGDRLGSPRISSLGVSVGQMGVGVLVPGEKAAMVVVAMGVGIASVVLGLVGVRSVAVGVDVGLHVGLDGRLSVGVVVLGVDVLALGALAVSGAAVGVSSVVGGFRNACDKKKSRGEGVH